MNFVESLSLFSGLKSSSPFIEESFFPIVAEKYITFCSENHQSKQWDHFQEYLNIITPVLKKNDISIVEIGSNKHNLNGIINLKAVTNANHWSYILKNSLLHVGPENFLTQLSSFLETPYIALFSNTDPSYCSPVWSNNKNSKSIKSPINDNKRSYASEESHKTINLISAEEVAHETLNLLGIKNDLNKYSITHIGNSYHQKLIEVVPDFIPDNNFFPKSLINIRMDYHFNESVLVHFANNRKVSIISEKEININLLLKIKPAIEKIYFKINEDFNVDYLEEIKKHNLPISLVALEDCNLFKTRLKFFDWEVMERIKKTKKDLDNSCKICDTTSYKSSKTIFSKDGQFSSKSSYDQKIKEHKDQLIIDEDSFWEDLDYIKLYNLTQNAKEKN